MIDLKKEIRIIEDFPKHGIQFMDITTLMKNGQAYQQAIYQLSDHAEQLQANLIVGPEARGFVIGAPIALKLGKGFVPVRKAGKLPAPAVECEYDLEYGTDVLAIHQDAIQPGQKVLIADDLLATGGTISSTINLVEQLGGQIVGCIFLIELTFLDGRQKIGPDYDIFSLIKYE